MTDVSEDVAELVDVYIEAHNDLCEAAGFDSQTYQSTHIRTADTLTTLVAENERLKTALIDIIKISESVIWGENSEYVTAALKMEKMAQEAMR